MKNHLISINSARRGLGMTPELRALIRRCAQKALALEGADKPLEIAVRVTDDREISELNFRHRGKGEVTDVLSFSMFPLSPGETVPGTPADIDPVSGRVFLGDIVISLDRAKEQAAEYGHTLSRELGFLTVHSVLHLLGYDHEREGDAGLMRRREEEILARLGLFREEASEKAQETEAHS